jgi:murein peptide amidase A
VRPLMTKTKMITRIGILGCAIAVLACFSFSAPGWAITGIAESVRDPAVEKWCAEIRTSVAALGWKALDPCENIDWKIGGQSVEGRSLVYAEFGDPAAKNVTLILSAVHGDEVTPVYLGLQLARWLKVNISKMPGTRVVIAPLLNPDGFYRLPRTRMNAHGVDVNRNFNTRDWDTRALAMWKNRFRSDPRRFPGNSARSEPETRIQEELIQKFHPEKILTIHSPLNHLDYDGPNQISLARFSQDYVRECMRLRAKLKAVSTGYFPGSLGNYAGQELGIPTITLELPTSNPKQAEHYWKMFNSGIRAMIEFVIPVPAVIPAGTHVTS